MKQCCALSFYCICFSVIKACSYWNSSTLDSITDHGNIFYTESCKKECLTFNNLPGSLQIYDATIIVTYNLQKQIKLCSTYGSSELKLHEIITNNINGNTGFLAWFTSTCICCIFNHKSRVTEFYFIVLNENEGFDAFEKVNISCLVQKIMHIASKNIQSDDQECQIFFLSCSTHISNSVRQSILRKHKSIARKKDITEKRKLDYESMEPALKTTIV